MKLSTSLLLFLAIVLLSQVDAKPKPAKEKCPPCEIKDCLYGLHKDAEKPGVCNCACNPCQMCPNCKYGVLQTKSDGCPDCTKCCSNPCDRNPCTGEKSICVTHKYSSPFSPICGVRYSCFKPGHPSFHCKDLKCKENENCVEGYPETNTPAKCGKFSSSIQEH